MQRTGLMLPKDTQGFQYIGFEANDVGKDSLDYLTVHILNYSCIYEKETI